MISIAELERPVAARSRLMSARGRDVGVVLGVSALLISAVLMLMLHRVASGRIDPVESTMSNYVLVEGVGWMFGVSVGCVGVAGLGLLLVLAGHDRLRGRLLRCVVSLASVSSLLAAVFPTNRAGPLTLAAEIHRYSAGVALGCVPIAALLVASALRSESTSARYLAPLRCSAVLTAALLGLFLASHFGVMPESVQQLRGLFQRTLFAAQLVLIAQLLAVSVAAGRGPARGPVLPAATVRAGTRRTLAASPGVAAVAVTRSAADRPSGFGNVPHNGTTRRSSPVPAPRTPARPDTILPEIGDPALSNTAPW